MKREKKNWESKMKNAEKDEDEENEKEIEEKRDKLRKKPHSLDGQRSK